MPRHVVRAIAGKGEAYHAVEDVEHAGTQINGLVHEAQLAEAIQYLDNGLCRDIGIGRIIYSRIGKAEIGVAEFVDAMNAEAIGVVHFPERGA